jgi:hypothetical protein
MRGRPPPVESPQIGCSGPQKMVPARGVESGSRALEVDARRNGPSPFFARKVLLLGYCLNMTAVFDIFLSTLVYALSTP